MECNKDEALRAKALAERKMLEKDFVGARKMINKAQKLCEEVDNISQMLTVCDVHCAAGMKVNGEIDWYKVLQVEPFTADDTLIKRQYRKLALLLHPDKNKFAGAEAAFKLVGEANMTLTDHSKRSVYDMKRKGPGKVGSARAPPYQAPRRTAHTTPVNLHNTHQQQHQASNHAGSQTFWTICPTCGMRYQYYVSVLKKAMRCQSCLKPFIAHDLNEQAVPSGENQQPAGVCKSNRVPQTHVPGQHAWSYTTPGVHANFGSRTDNSSANGRAGGNRSRATRVPKDKTKFSRTSKPSTAGLKRSRRSVVESSESRDSETTTDSEEEITGDGTAAVNAGPSQHSRRSSRQKQQVKYKEESDDDITYSDDDLVNSPNFKRSRKSGVLHSDDKSNETKLNEDKTGHNGSVNGLNHENVRQHATCMNAGSFMNTLKEDNRGHTTLSGVEGTNVNDESDDTVHVDIECHEPEFFEFSEIKLLYKFKPGQIWALYSDVDKFPNYYAFIKNVDLKNNKVQVRWLEACPRGEEEIRLVKENLTVGCGIFKVLSAHHVMTYTGTVSFSHHVQARSTGRRNEYEIIPRLGEIWAVYKNWRTGWTAEHYKNCDYELVEILGHTDSSTQVQHLRKVGGYRAVFRRGDSVKTISKDEYPKFSHQIPCFHLTNEMGGKLRGFMELDPNSVPEEFLCTDSI